MNHFAFMQLCRETSRPLGLADIEALGTKERSEVEGVEFELLQDITTENVAFLILVLGEVEEQYKAEVYETLFVMQGIFHGTTDAIFDYDDINCELLFRIRLPLSGDTRADGLATVIRSFVWQVIEWKKTVLKGKLVDDELDDDDSGPLQDKTRPSVLTQTMA